MAGPDPDDHPLPHDACPAAKVDGNDIRALCTGAERFKAILDLIDGARSDLRLLFYMFTEDVAGAAVVEALTRAAERGVRVQLLVDGFGCGYADTEFLAPLRAAGGQFCLFHPSYGRRYLIRNHQKLVIADRQTALIGGANVNLHYLVDQGDEHWRDLWMSIAGPAVAELSDYFDDINRWTHSGKHRIRDLRRIIHEHSHGSGKVSWLFSGPMRRRNPWPRSLAAELDRCRHLDMIAAYFSPSGSMIRRIGRVAKRGEARIVTAARSDNNATIAAARYTYDRLLRQGVKLFEYRPAKLHTKLYIVDDVVHVGSANFDFRSLYINLEMMLRIDDKGFADQMRRYVDGEVADSTAITPQLHRARATLWRRFKWWVSHWLVTTVDYTVTRRINFGVE